jgi:hypothetical protein
MKFRFLLFLVILLGLAACEQTPLEPTPTPVREALIPADQVKVTVEDDFHPPVSLTEEYTDPEPLPSPVNTAGVEDSAFITPDGNILYVWFTPDSEQSVEEQLRDGVTGIYEFRKDEQGWGAPRRVVLQEPGKLALDGCAFGRGNTLWFCSAREGYVGMEWFRAERLEGRWGNWQRVEFNPDYEVGELHITQDGQEMYFHSPRPGGQGGYDIWVSEKEDGAWGHPVNLAVVNSPHSEGWPFITANGSELWFTRSVGWSELWRSKKVAGEWGEPEKMFEGFAGEPSLDQDGTLYFTHHYFKDDIMLEADIYVAHPTAP